jgi:hypothetical protein
MSEVNTSDIVLPKLFTTSGTFSMPIAQVFVNTLFTKQVETPSNRTILESILADRAAKHIQGHI